MTFGDIELVNPCMQKTLYPRTAYDQLYQKGDTEVPIIGDTFQPAESFVFCATASSKNKGLLGLVMTPGINFCAFTCYEIISNRGSSIGEASRSIGAKFLLFFSS